MKHRFLWCTSVAAYGAFVATGVAAQVSPQNNRTGQEIGSDGALSEATAPAQQTTSAQDTDPSDGTQVGEIVVTAQRREQNLQDVPLAVTAFSAAEVGRRVSFNSTDLLKFVPNVLAFNNGNQQTSANYYFRGIGTADGLQTFDSPVITYVDEVPLGRIVGANLNFFDVERVEVLRGPQGTLFGRNIVGGAVLYTSRKPSDQNRFAAQASYGSRDRFEGIFSVDVPLADGIYTSFSAYGFQEDGWQRSVLNNQKFNAQYGFGGRAALRYEPSDRLVWNLSVDYDERQGLKPNVPGLKPTFLLGPTETVPNYNKASGTALGDYGLLYSLANSCRTGEKNNAQSWALNNCADSITTGQGLTSNLAYDLNDNLTIALITGARITDQHSVLEVSGNTIGATFLEWLFATDSQYRQVSQEIKLTGNLLDNRLNFVGGLFYFQEKIRSRIGYRWLFPAAGYTTLRQNQDVFLNNQTKSYAGYLQADLGITEELTLTAGGRVTRDDKKVDVRYFAYNPAGRDPARDFNTSQISGDPVIKSTRFTPKVSLQYKFTPDIQAYASYTTGFQSGGWSGRSGTALGFNSFDDMKAKSYEIGLRSELFDKRLRFNATLFRVEYDDLQINTAFTPPGGTVTVFVTGNSGDARNQGIEIESQFVFTPELTGNIAIGLQDSKYTRLSPTAVTASGFVVGGPLSQAPPETFSGGLVYSKDIDPLKGQVTVSASGQYLPSYNPNLFASSRLTENLFLLNSQISYAPHASRVEFALECRNCTNKYYVINTVRQGGGALGEIPYYGVRLRYRM